MELKVKSRYRSAGVLSALFVSMGLIVSVGITPSSGAAKAPKAAEIKVGIMDPALGAATNLYNQPGRLAGSYYVNHDLHGIHGQQVDFITCKVDGSVALETTCANSLVSDHVVAVIGENDQTEGTSYPIFAAAHIPYITATSQSAQTDGNVPYNIDFYAPQGAF